MSTTTDGSMLTLKGLALLAKLIATRTALQISRAAIGDGELMTGTPPEAMTGLSSYVMDMTLASISNPANGEVKIILQLLSTDVATAFIGREIVVYATDPDEGEIAYAYIPLQSYPVQMRAAGGAIGKIFTMEISLVVSNVSSVVANINPAGLVRREDLAQYALVTHTHVIADIAGLSALLADLQNRIALLDELMSGDMPGGINFAMDFAALSNVDLAAGQWITATQSITA